MYVRPSICTDASRLPSCELVPVVLGVEMAEKTSMALMNGGSVESAVALTKTSNRVLFPPIGSLLKLVIATRGCGCKIPCWVHRSPMLMDNSRVSLLFSSAKYMTTKYPGDGSVGCAVVFQGNLMLLEETEPARGVTAVCITFVGESKGSLSICLTVLFVDIKSQSGLMKENHILSSGSAGYLTVSIIGDLE